MIALMLVAALFAPCWSDVECPGPDCPEWCEVVRLTTQPVGSGTVLREPGTWSREAVLVAAEVETTR